MTNATNATTLPVLEKLYFNQKFSLEKIGELVGIHPNVVRRRLNKAGHKLRPWGHHKHSGVPTESLKKWYDEGLTLKQVGVRAKMSGGAVRSRLINAGYKLRPHPRRGRKKLVVPLDALAKLYFEQKLGLKQCGKQMGISTSTAGTLLRNAGYETRSSGPAPMALSTEEIVRLYNDDQLTTEQIAQKYGRSPWLIWKTLANAGCKRRTHAENFTKNFIRRNAAPRKRRGPKEVPAVDKTYFRVGAAVETKLKSGMDLSDARRAVAKELKFAYASVVRYHKTFRALEKPTT